MTSAPPPATAPQESCASDPDFASIFAFCERFGDSCCGITVPTFQELQDMLENTKEVPGTLVDLHVKLLRRVKKAVHVDKWEKAVLKFCHAYSIPESWELEHYGYQGISIKLKLRILKTLLEAQFDSNVKFKSEINKLESSVLRAQPLGWDKSGTAYWVQFDRNCNIRVYKEDNDEHTWEIVARDRSTLVNLINELSGSKDSSLDDIEDSNSIDSGSEEEVCTNIDQEKLLVASSNSTSNIEEDKKENNIKDPKNSNNLKIKLDDNSDKEVNLENETNFPVVGETIEEAVMVVKGEGSGQECDMGNPDEPNNQDETSKNEDIKKPKLWSIDTICSSSKEAKEEIISVPKLGFFFGDDSVTCFNNVSNGESSHSDDDKLKVDPQKDNAILKTTENSDAEVKMTEKSSKMLKTTEETCEVLKTTEKPCEVLETIKKTDEILKTNEKLYEVLKTTEESDKLLKTNEISVAEVKTTEKSCEVLKTTEKSNVEVKTTEKPCEVLKTTEKKDEILKINEKSQEVLKTTEKSSKVMKTTEKPCEVLKITEKKDEILKMNEKSQEVLKTNEKSSEVLETTEKKNEILKMNEKSQEVLKTTEKSPEVLKMIEKSDEVDDCTTALIATKLLNEKCISKSEEEFDCEKKSNQSVFNIKVHEEEVQITERKANEPFTKSESNLRNETKVNESILVDNHSEVFQLISTPEIVETKTDSHLIDDTDKHKTIIKESFQMPQATSSSQIVETKQNVFPIVVTDYKVIQNNIIDQCGVNSINDKVNKLFPILIKDQTTINNKSNNENSLEFNKLLTNKPNQCDKIENIKGHHKKIESIDTNEQQNVNFKVQNLPKLVEKTISNEINPLGSVTDNQILTKISYGIDNKEATVNLLVKDNKIDKKFSEEIKEHTVDNSTTENATCSKNDLNQLTKNDDSSLNTIKYSKVHGEIITEGDKKCLNTSKQINNDQNNYVTSKNTSHNIRNIIANDAVVSDCNKAIKQSTDLFYDRNNQSENCKIKNENILQKETESFVNIDSQIVSSCKHGSDEILIKQHDTTKIPVGLNLTKETTEAHKLLNELNSPNNNVDKVCSEKSKINITKLKTKTTDSSIDLNIVKDNDKVTEIKANTQFMSGSSQKVNTIDQVPKLETNDKIVATSMDQCVEVKKENLKLSSTKITSTKCKKNKHKSLNTENKAVTCVKDELKNTICDKKNVARDVNKNTPPIKIDEKNSDDILLHDKKMPVDYETENLKVKLPKDSKVTDCEDRKVNILANLKKKLKTKTNIENIEGEDIVLKISDEQTTDLIHEKTEEILAKSSKEECDNSKLTDQNDYEIQENDEVEESPKKGKPVRKKGKRGKAKNTTPVKKENKDDTEQRVKRKYTKRPKAVTIVEEVTVIPELSTDDNKRRSRRIAEIKIKEQVIPNEQYEDLDIPLIKVSKKKDKIGKKVSTPTKKIININESDDDNDNEDNLVSKKFKKKKKKGKPGSLKKSNTVDPWNLDSGSSSSENHVELFEDYDHEEEDETPRPGIELNVSDHEFSPESDIEDDEEFYPEKRARTARKKDPGGDLEDEMACRKCNKSDQPEWILLCDTCNQGWHASCLRPPLMVIPDGDWYCPSCRHISLLNALKDVLKKYDGESKKRENEELRRKRLAYVGISLQNVIPTQKENAETGKPTTAVESSDDDEEESESESESYDSEPLYQLRARRQTNVSYRFNDYDNMIDEAIFEETGIDESASRKLTEVKTDKNDNDENSETDNEESKNREGSPIAPALLHLRGRKKSKKLTNLDISSDDGSDEDFKGPSDEDDDFDEELSEYSDDSVKKRAQPTRRSVRTRKNIVDPDFINDDSSDNDNRPKKKRSRPWSESSNSEDEDLTWGKKKKKQSNAPSSSSYKQSKKSKRKHNSNRKSKIKYGMDSDSDGQPQRRTRGRQVTYAESDDSEEEVQVKKRKKGSDEEDEFVLNDEELEVDNEDHNLETDDEDAIVSNEDKNEDETDEEEEETVIEEVDSEEDEKEEEKTKNNSKPKTTTEEDKTEDNPKLKMTAEEDKTKDNSKPKTTTDLLQTAVKSQCATTEVVQSVIREPIIISSPVTTGKSRPNVIHHRLSPDITDKQVLPQLSVDSSKTVEKSDKHKKQTKKCLSPNPSSIGSSGYSFPPGTTKVVPTTVSTIPIVSVLYNKPHATLSTTVGGFKSIGTTAPLPPAGFHAAPYRTTNKTVTEAVTAVVPSIPSYHSPQAYQVPLPTNFSSYPINYAASETPVPPPPPTIPFRNVVVTPTQIHETHPSPPRTVITQQPSVTPVTGDSEFGGLVSYFSSQQEDDFDA